MTDLAISILVHEDFTYIDAALQSIAATTITPHEITIVINKGDAAAIDKLQQAYPQHQYIINPTPQGFAANHNQVMRRVNAPYIALLNDDILIQDTALDTLVAYMRQNPSVGVVTPQLEYADGSPQVTVYSDPSLLRMIFKISGLGVFTHQQSRLRQLLVKLGIGRLTKTASMRIYDAPQSVDVVKAAAIIVHQEAVKAVGMMDETTRAYGEEIDWHLRMRQAGWQVAIVPAARITHYGTGQALMQLRGWQITEDRKAILNYYLKHKPYWQGLMIRLAIVGLHVLQMFVALIVAPSQVSAHWNTVKLGLFWRRSARE